MNARDALKTIRARLDDQWQGSHVEDALDVLEECVEALEILATYVENRKGHAKPYAPAMGRARAVLEGRQEQEGEESPAAEKLLRIVENAKGDNLERANIAFRGLSHGQMQEEHGGSGRTRQTILDGYRSERAEWQAAKELLIKLFKEEKC